MHGILEPCFPLFTPLSTLYSVIARRSHHDEDDYEVQQLQLLFAYLLLLLAPLLRRRLLLPIQTPPWTHLCVSGVVWNF